MAALVSIMRALAFASVLVVLVSCSNQPSSSSDSTSSTTGARLEEQNSKSSEIQQYIRAVKTSAFGRVEEFSITYEYLARRREELVNSSLKALSLSSDYNTDVYLIEGNSDSATVIARPRVFLKSSTSGERVRLKEDVSGRVSIEVSVALVDGMISQLFTGKGTRPIPDELLIRNKEAFIGDLEVALKTRPSFISTIRCPDSIKLRIDTIGEFPVEFKSKLTSCPINTLFPAQISLKHEHWQAVILAFAEGRRVEVETSLNLSIPVATNYGKFVLKKAMIQSAWRDALKSAKAPFSSADIAGAQQDLVAQIQNSLAVSFPQELFTSFLDDIVRDTLRQKFGNDCPDGASLCFLWSTSTDSDSREDYRFEVRREEYFGKPIVLNTRSLVTDYLSDHQEFMLRAAPENLLEPPKTTEVSQLFRTVQEGEIAEFEIKHIKMGEVNFPEPKVNRISNKVCIDPYSLCTEGMWRCINTASENYNCRNDCTGGHKRVCIKSTCMCADEPGGPCSWCPGRATMMKCWEWQDQCQGWSQVCDRRRVCDRLKAPMSPNLPFKFATSTPVAPDFEWNCTKFAQNQCDPNGYADHWQRIVTWATPAMHQNLREVPWLAEYWDKTIAGLGIKFSWATDAGTQMVVCPLGSLEHRILARNKLLVVFKNSAGCQVFNDQNRKPGRGPTVGLTNQITFPSEFQCGSLTENWEGKRRYVCRTGDKPEISFETTAVEDERKMKRGERIGIYQSYYPRIELQGTLRIVGSEFQSGEDLL